MFSYLFRSAIMLSMFHPSFIQQHPDFYRAIVAQILAQREPITAEQDAMITEITKALASPDGEA
jgi:hypothetical protein